MISVNEVKCCRKITLKGIYGQPQVLKTLIQQFKKRVGEATQGIPGSTQIEMLDESNDFDLASSRTQDIGNQTLNSNGTKIFKGTLRRRSSIGKQPEDFSIEEEDDCDTNASISLQQNSSFYEIQKILCSDQYTIGKNVQEYISSFHQQYKNLKESS